MKLLKELVYNVGVNLFGLVVAWIYLSSTYSPKLSAAPNASTALVQKQEAMPTPEQEVIPTRSNRRAVELTPGHQEGYMRVPKSTPSVVRTVYLDEQAIQPIYEIDHNAGVFEFGNLRLAIYNLSSSTFSDGMISLRVDLQLKNISNPGHYIYVPEDALRITNAAGQVIPLLQSRSILVNQMLPPGVYMRRYLSLRLAQIDPQGYYLELELTHPSLFHDQLPTELPSVIRFYLSADVLREGTVPNYNLIDSF